MRFIVEMVHTPPKPPSPMGDLPLVIYTGCAVFQARIDRPTETTHARPQRHTCEQKKRPAAIRHGPTDQR